MMSVLANIEQTWFSVWVRESPSLLAFPFILYLHTLGLAMLAGLNVGLDVWLLSAKNHVPAVRQGVYQVMWLGFGINAISGLALLAAYPAKALTNWVFFTKLALIAVAMWVLEITKRELIAADRGETAAVSDRVRRLAMLSIALWGATIFAGRLLAYTHSILLASEGF
jgi:hypothetical protein